MTSSNLSFQRPPPSNIILGCRDSTYELGKDITVQSLRGGHEAVVRNMAFILMMGSLRSEETGASLVLQYCYYRVLSSCQRDRRSAGAAADLRGHCPQPAGGRAPEGQAHQAAAAPGRAAAGHMPPATTPGWAAGSPC